MARTIAIWIFGLLGSGLLGYLIGGLLYDEQAGMFAFMFLFACFRLWLNEPSNKNQDQNSN